MRGFIDWVFHLHNLMGVTLSSRRMKNRITSVWYSLFLSSYPLLVYWTMIYGFVFYNDIDVIGCVWIYYLLTSSSARWAYPLCFAHCFSSNVKKGISFGLLKLGLTCFTRIHYFLEFKCCWYFGQLSMMLIIFSLEVSLIGAFYIFFN